MVMADSSRKAYTQRALLTLVSAIKDLRWSALRTVGNSAIVRASIVMPVVGYLILLNKNLVTIENDFGHFFPPSPWRLISGDDHRHAAVSVSEEGIACTKAVCNYVHQTYGRFPATVDAMHLMWLMQAHHLDTDYYDRFFRPGAYGSTHAGHMAKWHP
jgi:hypothetical protein